SKSASSSSWSCPSRRRQSFAPRGQKVRRYGRTRRTHPTVPERAVIRVRPPPDPFGTSNLRASLADPFGLGIGQPVSCPTRKLLATSQRRPRTALPHPTGTGRGSRRL